MSPGEPVGGRWRTLTAAPHRLLFFTGIVNLAIASVGWLLHLAARLIGAPLAALDLSVAPIWAHAFPMLFTVLPAFMFGFLYTTFPRWMDGPQVPRPAFLGTAIALVAATVAWTVGLGTGATMLIAAGALAVSGLATGLVALLRVLVDARTVVSHAIVASTAVAIGLVAAGGFGWGIATGDEFALHFAVRAALWGFLLPVFFAVCHRMIPFFSQNALPGYVAWRPTWVLVAVASLAWSRLLLGTAGLLQPLVWIDAALVLVTATCVVRWTSLRARGNALLWTLYVGAAWLPVAMTLQAVRDGTFAATGQWVLGRAPIHALAVGCFGTLLVAMVTRVTAGHSGRPLRMDLLAFACFLGVQFAAITRVASELVASPVATSRLLVASAALWLLAFAAWSVRNAGIYLSPRVDGRPG
jgi:uncharacterized protein involved in response to NO